MVWRIREIRDWTVGPKIHLPRPPERARSPLPRFVAAPWYRSKTRKSNRDATTHQKRDLAYFLRVKSAKSRNPLVGETPPAPPVSGRFPHPPLALERGLEVPGRGKNTGAGGGSRFLAEIELVRGAKSAKIAKSVIVPKSTCPFSTIACKCS